MEDLDVDCRIILKLISRKRTGGSGKDSFGFWTEIGSVLLYT